MEKKKAEQKITKRDESEKRKLINRLNRVEGQIKGIRKMIEEDRYTPDILVQSSAAKAAMEAFNKAILSDHLRNVVPKDIRNNNDEALNDLITVIGSGI